MLIVSQTAAAAWRVPFVLFSLCFGLPVFPSALRALFTCGGTVHFACFLLLSDTSSKGHVFFLPICFCFLPISFLCFFRYFSLSLNVGVSCLSYQFKYDDKASHCLVCVLDNNVVSLCRSFVTTELVSLED